ncbi:MAG: DUF1700 domain-containing protein [Burkholderiaceae bacterium]|nr:DUF1700 domain-containing protein [Burkholderiaceae bacterium]
MNRFEYLDALRNALRAAPNGMPEAMVAAIVADCERRFAERSTADQTEEEIMAGMGDPQQLAAQKVAEMRAALQPNASLQKKGAPNLFRMFFSVIGLSVFNLFMLIPGVVYASLLFAAFVTSLAFYGSGIVVTAASLAGVGGQSTQTVMHDRVHASGTINSDDGKTSIAIGDAGLHIKSAAPASATADAKTMAAPAKAAAKGDAVAATTSDRHDAGRNADHQDSASLSVRDDNGARIDIDDAGVSIRSDDDDFPRVVILGSDLLGLSRVTLAVIGICLVMGGTVLFLLCLAVGRFTWIGLSRLAQMEFAVLKGA